jgi:hypothetical protein
MTPLAQNKGFSRIKNILKAMFGKNYAEKNCLVFFP